MNKHYSIASILALSSLFLGMSKPIEKQVLPASDDQQETIERKAQYTKPHAAIYLDYQSPGNLTIDDQLELRLNFKVRDQAKQLQVKVSLEDILLLQSDSQFEFDTSGNKQNSVTILATALKEGTARIKLDTTILVEGRYQSRSFIIPVIVGDPAQFKSVVTGRVISRPGYTVDKEHGVVSMPAVEASE